MPDTRPDAVQAVKGVDLDVKAGEIFGFLGPNGAGKTTTLRMLATLIPPTSGEATVAGVDLIVALSLLSLIGLTMAPLSYTLALLLKSEDALAPLVTTISLPLLLLSGILLPLTLAPDWLQTLAKINPLSHAVDAIRALFNGHFGDPSVGFGRSAA